jgi:hypothetical protein
MTYKVIFRELILNCRMNFRFDQQHQLSHSYYLPFGGKLANFLLAVRNWG